jgi:hypothetical protein
MAKSKFDGVVEAVHYTPEGQVDWVRVYERRGSTFSDRQIIKRQDFIERLQAGRKYMVGKRVLLMASTFDTSEPVHYLPRDGDGALVTGDRQHADQDILEGVPVI